MTQHNSPVHRRATGSWKASYTFFKLAAQNLTDTQPSSPGATYLIDALAVPHDHKELLVHYPAGFLWSSVLALPLWLLFSGVHHALRSQRPQLLADPTRVCHTGSGSRSDEIGVAPHFSRLSQLRWQAIGITEDKMEGINRILWLVTE